MATPRHAPFFFSDDPALDFLNSLTVTQGQELEWLGNGAGLLTWLEQAQATAPSVLASFRANASTKALDAVALEARELREWFRTFVEAHAGKPLRPLAADDLTPLNRILEEDAAYRQIEAVSTNSPQKDNGHGVRALCWRESRRWRTPIELLLPIADAIGELCQKDFTLIRRCENPGCALWFLDVSKSHARRWCRMAICGNRAKVTAHRARSRQRDVRNDDRPKIS